MQIVNYFTTTSCHIGIRILELRTRQERSDKFSGTDYSRRLFYCARTVSSDDARNDARTACLANWYFTFQFDLLCVIRVGKTSSTSGEVLIKQR